MLQHIVERGLKLHTHIEVLSHDPFEGPLTVRADGVQQIVGHNVAACIFVETLP
jgi:Fe2+ transport system protein FeoA